MKWVFLSLLVLVAGGVATFAIYTFGWRNGDNAEEDERLTATAYAAEVAAACTTEETAGCEVESVERAAPGIWRVQLDLERGADECYTLHLDDFRPLPGGGFEGVSFANC
jgi:hypothetical protein